MKTSAPETMAMESEAKRIEGLAWGALFLWIGLALLAHVSWGAGLLGAGAIMLLSQAWRRRLRVRAQGFSVLLGGVLAICGVLSLLELEVDLVPILLIVAGIAVLFSNWTMRGDSSRPTDTPGASQSDQNEKVSRAS